MTATGYVHGYSSDEARRLGEQADALAALLHAGVAYRPGARVLEAGCGVGAQTVHLVASSPAARFDAVDLSADSLTRARERLAEAAPGADVRFHRADLRDLPFADAAFDHVFVCFVLEHLADPHQALVELRRVLRPGGTLTVIEGDHDSAFFHPDSTAARSAIECLIRVQARDGGDARIGRRLQPLLAAAGYRDVAVSPRTAYADETRPDLALGITRNTFVAMVEAVRPDVLAAGLSTPDVFDAGIADLCRAAEPGGTFSYTFFVAVARR